MVELEHPNLPGRIINIRERGVPQRLKAGWRPVKPKRRRNPPVETPETAQDVDTESA